MMTSTQHRPSVADRWRRTWFRTRFSWAMQDYPRREYRRIARDLRQQIDEAATEVGMGQALADLGPPRALAEGYAAELDRPVPRWSAGAVAAGGVFLFLFYFFFAYAIGTLDTLRDLGGASVTRHPSAGRSRSPTPTTGSRSQAPTPGGGCSCMSCRWRWPSRSARGSGGCGLAAVVPRPERVHSHEQKLIQAYIVTNILCHRCRVRARGTPTR